ncbi:MAG: DUF4221 domain-containing protein [Tannerella sp.]|jgi:hypothetical protein|nr:DUF4221 domain-containing protein [Tannerella sp.]
MKSTYFLLLILLSLSCKREVSLIENGYGEPVFLSLTKVDIPIDSVTINSYDRLSTYTHDNDNYILAYNYKTHALDNFNVNKQTVSHIELMHEGSDGINEIQGFHAHSADSIRIYGTNNIISLIDSTGKVKERINIPSLNNGVSFVMTNFSICTSKLFYNSDRNSLFFLTLSVRNEKNSFFVTELSLPDYSTKTYPVNTITEKDFRNDYGWKQAPNVTYTNKTIIYNFPVESNIYVINIESGKTSIHGGKSRHTSNEVSKLKTNFDMPEGERHINENVHFFDILHDPLKNIYYRLHLDRIEYNAQTDFRTLYLSKDIYLMVYNEKFEVINETKLDSRKYNYFNCWGMLSNGLFIAKDNALNNDTDFEQFQIDIFNIK